MKADILIKINSDPKLKEFINNNSYWYKYLNRGSSYYKNFMDAYKGYKKNERINKTNSKDEIGYITGEDTNLLKNSDIPIMDVQSTGSVYTKLNVSNVFVIKNMKNIDENSFVVKQEEKMNEELTIDNFIDDFKL